ncbi:RDD family protein [Streptomyces botrytidirepellens]|uniref:RDD family protein n=1 Tax=Streptomyces botrytidirepellens TaxID=2486417 RepID=A0A3M8VJ52_9ACTN|nr:RDD family protein [Streptomyces botrytidirepellens]RNG17628.1 RDD family protein [Streptomyces botrytidirepellens]
MSAPSSGSADGSSIPGFYPDPSIPNYIRYWNGAAWVPGTSRPAPAEGEAMPAAPPGVTHTQVTSPVPDETGPMFLDEDPEPGPAVETGGALPEVRRRAEMDVRESGPGSVMGTEPVPPAGTAAPVDWDDPQRLHGTRPGAGAAWQADASHQAGFGGEQDRRISWGSESEDPRAGVPDPRGAADGDVGGEGSGRGEGGRDEGTLTMRGGGAEAGAGAGDRKDRATHALPAVRNTPELPSPSPSAEAGAGAGAADGTMAIRALRPTGRDEGTMTFRTLDRDAPPQGPQQSPPQQQPQPQQQQPHQPQQPPQRQQPPQQPYGGIPAQPSHGGPGGPGGGWQQQVHQLAQQPPQPQSPQAPAPQQGAPESVIPWKPPVDNPFLQAAQAQGRPAGLGRRFSARLIDMVVLLAITGAAAFPLWGKAADHIDGKVETAKQSGETVTVYFLDGTTSGYLAIVLGVLLLGGILLEALPTAVWGRTLGKKLCGVRVLDIEEHDTPSFGAALRRWLVYGVLGVLVVGLVNVLWCLVDRPWRQCWHDKAARTFVATAD